MTVETNPQPAGLPQAYQPTAMIPQQPSAFSAFSAEEAQAAADHYAAQQAEADRFLAERAAAEQSAAEQQAPEQAYAEQAYLEQAAAEQMTVEQTSAEQTDQQADEQAYAERAAAEEALVRREQAEHDAHPATEADLPAEPDVVPTTAERAELEGEADEPALSVIPFLRALSELSGSDLHVKVGAAPRIRIDGRLRRLKCRHLTPRDTEHMLGEVIRHDVVAEFAETNEGDFAFSLAGVGRFRVNAYRARGSIGLVFRRVSVGAVALTELGVPEVIASLALEPRGLVLVTGPTGSGKTTTLAGMVDHINTTKEVHIVTIEDPIEVMHVDKNSIINQREVGLDTRNFAVALRAAMRQDPDVVLVGEMRDAETVGASLSASETGHFVMSTLHTTDAAETITRVIDFFPPHEQKQVRLSLSAALKGIICQRLVPRADGQGRVVVMEICVNNGRIADAIADPEKTHMITDLIKEGTFYGMQTFDQHLVSLYRDKAIKLDDAMHASSNPHDLQVELRAQGLL